MNIHFIHDLWFYKSLVCSRFLKALGILFTIDKFLECFGCFSWLQIHDFYFGLAICTISLLWGIWILIKTKQKVTLKINNRTRLSIFYGDLFKERHIRVIPVNEYFDTHLDDGIIAPNTVHGQFLKRYITRIPELRRKIDAQLQHLRQLPNTRQRNMVAGLPQNPYPLGTTIRIEMDGQYYLLVAVTRFNQVEHVDVADSEYMGIMQRLFYHIEQLNDGKSVSLPLIGSGQAGFGYTNMQLLNLIVQAASLSDRLAVIHGINVVLYDSESMRKSINLSVIKSLYDNWKIL